ncbi:hypothetical protein NKI88_12165 [Mesorhizobium sp. M0317]|uniref:hypothetical protein n=1 Tax=unclassified Mesorhizobium TaxID=325217 RepID=UPI0003CEAC61|nr:MULTISPECIES: hypothetical protein [unclassified Mesorhizobium]ESY16119.1 hypothetical protein X750_27175 [Mesorhizobium sp. LNJC394B00]ESZ75076.1 hypothetical protein X726_18925 [Mesorhizobium sp. L103C105A0]
MVTLNFTDTDLILLELALQELPEKARNALGTRINQQIIAQREALAKAAEDEPKSPEKREGRERTASRAR